MDVPPPPTRTKVQWLELIALASAIVGFVTFGVLGSAWTQFSGDWNGPLGLVNGRSGKVWLVVEAAWTYLIPLILVLAASVVATFGCLLARVLRDARR